MSEEVFADIKPGDDIQILTSFKVSIVHNANQTQELYPNEVYNVLMNKYDRIVITSTDTTRQYWITNLDIPSLKIIDDEKDPHSEKSSLQKGSQIIILKNIMAKVVPDNQRKLVFPNEICRVTGKQYGCLMVKKLGAKDGFRYWIKIRHANRVKKIASMKRDSDSETLTADIQDTSKLMQKFLDLQKKHTEIEETHAEKKTKLQKTENFINATWDNMNAMNKQLEDRQSQLQNLQKENETLKENRNSFELNKTTVVDDFDDLIHGYKETIHEQLDIFEKSIKRVQKDFNKSSTETLS